MAKKYEFIITVRDSEFSKSIYEDGQEVHSHSFMLFDDPIMRYIFEGTLKELALERERCAREVFSKGLNATVGVSLRDTRARKPAGFDNEAERKVFSIVKETIKDRRTDEEHTVTHESFESGLR